MTRILHITGSLARNGTETFIMNLFHEALKHNIIFDFLLTNNSINGYDEEAVSLGSKIYMITPRRENPFKYKIELDNFFKEHSSEYLCVHMSGNSMSSIAPLKYAKKYKIPIRMYHSHNSTCSGLHNRIFHSINKLFISKYATNYLACSKNALKWAFSHTRAEKDAIVINNGIDLKKYAYSTTIRDTYRKILNFKEEFVIGHVGRFMKEKNHKFLIDVFKEIKKIHSNSTLLLIGEGELLDKMTAYVDDLNISDSVKFLGIRDDVQNLYQVMDLFIMPSLFEGFPIALIEAQAADLPILASNSISKEVAITKNIKFLNITDSPKEWAKIALSYINHNSIRSNKAEDLIEYDSQFSMQKIIDIYRKPPSAD